MVVKSTRALTVGAAIAIIGAPQASLARMPILPGQRDERAMPGGAAARKFNYLPGEYQAVLSQCIDGGKGQLSGQRLTNLCGCATQSMQWSLTRPEFEILYGERLVAKVRRAVASSEEKQRIKTKMALAAGPCRPAGWP